MRETIYLTPKVQVTPKGDGFATWCRGCGTLGYAASRACAKGFEKRHARCKEQHER